MPEKRAAYVLSCLLKQKLTPEVATFKKELTSAINEELGSVRLFKLSDYDIEKVATGREDDIIYKGFQTPTLNSLTATDSEPVEPPTNASKAQIAAATIQAMQSSTVFNPDDDLKHLMTLKPSSSMCNHINSALNKGKEIL